MRCFKVLHINKDNNPDENTRDIQQAEVDIAGPLNRNRCNVEVFVRDAFGVEISKLEIDEEGKVFLPE